MTLVKLETPELTVIEESKAAKIKATFEPMVEMLEQFENQYNEIISESEKEITLELCQKAKRTRLDIGKVRIETDKLRKAEKEEYLRAGKAIDGVSNILKWAVSEKENKLKEIEDYFEIQEKKRLEELQSERIKMLSPYVEDAHERDLSGMELDVWNAYLAAKQKEYTDRIEAEKEAERQRIEQERMNKLHSERKEIVLPYYDFIKDQDINNLGFMELDKFTEFVELLKKEKAEHDKEQEIIRKEKERLEKEAKEKELRIRKRNEELKPYIIFIRDYNNLLELNEKEYQKEFADIKLGAEQHWEFERQEQIKKANQQKKDEEERKKLEAKIKAKEEAEQKEKQRLLDEKLAKEKAEKAARLAPDKEKLLKFAEQLDNLSLPELRSNEAGEILKNIVTLITKTTNYIKEKAESL